MAKKFPRKTTQATKTSGWKQGTTGSKHGKRSAPKEDKRGFPPAQG